MHYGLAIGNGIAYRFEDEVGKTIRHDDLVDDVHLNRLTSPMTSNPQAGSLIETGLCLCPAIQSLQPTAIQRYKVNATRIWLNPIISLSTIGALIQRVKLQLKGKKNGISMGLGSFLDRRLPARSDTSQRPA